jgi:hypothetical protein
MTSSTQTRYAGHRFPPELISYMVWLYFRFPLSLRMVEEMLAFRGIEVSYETICQWGLKFGQEFANRFPQLSGQAAEGYGNRYQRSYQAAEIRSRSAATRWTWMARRRPSETFSPR